MPNRTDIDQALSEALSRYFDASGPNNLLEAVRYSLLAPGRRLRPRLTIACAEMIALNRDIAFSVAIALEMLHCFTLIHDDLPSLDNDEIRRGQPTNHKKFGEALAVLSGDALVPLALDVFFEISGHVKDSNFILALRRLSQSVGPRGVIGGQAGEMLLNTGSTLDDLRQVHAKKTGAFFLAALLIPKDLAGISDDSSEGIALDIFARELGLAYQVLDDLEDFATQAQRHKQKEETVEIRPNHVLYYLPENEARSMTLQRLNNATLSLSSNWGPKAQPLLQIADELRKKLQVPT
jgi:geranylgeranyl diphosphate synthase, type II